MPIKRYCGLIFEKVSPLDYYVLGTNASANPTGITAAKIWDRSNATGVKKYMKNGSLVIETARGTFSAAGAQLK